MRAGALFRALLAAAVAAIAGCASAPPCLTHPELPRKKDDIAVAGVLPPTIRMFEEQARFSTNEAVPRDDWSSVANEAVARAFADEMADDHVRLVPIGADDPDANELAELYNAVEFSILRHAFEKNTGELLPREPFPEKLHAPDDSLGPAAEFMERRHVDQVDQKFGAFPLAAWSSKTWPVRTAKNLTNRFVAGMPPADAAEILLGSRHNDPSVADFALRKVVTRTIAGQQAFRSECEFRLVSSEADRWPVYRSASCGFMLGEWFYGITYTAAARSYFDRDAETFETFLESVRVEAP